MHSLWDEMETILQRQRELRQQSIVSPSHGCGNPNDDVDRDNDPNSQAFIADSLHTENGLSNHFAPHQEPNMTHEASEPIGLSGLEDFMLHEPPTASHMPETLCQDTGLDLDTNFDMLATNDDSIDRITYMISECYKQVSVTLHCVS